MSNTFTFNMIWPVSLILLFVEISSSQLSCPRANDPSDILVHLIPHSHLDVGWLKTVDQYFYGLSSSIQKANVQDIFDTVYLELYRDPKKRFLITEIAFFSRWYVQQSSDIRDRVKKMVFDGQMFFGGGGWVMSDEACTHYRATIDQMTLGRSFLRCHFDTVPNTSWQIDPFGHSGVHAELMYLMNMNGAIINRIDYRTREHLNANRTNEFLWSIDSENESLLPTSHMYIHYSPPSEFCFDVFCNDDPVIASGSHMNAKDKSEKLLSYIREQSSFYKSKHLLLPMGSDFHYQNAMHNFKSLDNLLEAIEQLYQSSSKTKDKPRIDVRYSSIDCYMNAMKKDLEGLMIKYKGDFLPYCHNEHCCWTGYYTSRQGLKQLERTIGTILQVFRQLIVQSSNVRDYDNDILAELESSHAILQHHDAITGTCKQAVANDYILMNLKAIQRFQDNYLADIIGVDGKYEICINYNISQCAIPLSIKGRQKLTSQGFMVYNSMSNGLNSICYVNVRKGFEYSLTLDNGSFVESQLLDLPAGMFDVPERSKESDAELAFRCNVAPMSMQQYVLDAGPGGRTKNAKMEHSDGLLHLSSKHLDISVSNGNRLLMRSKGNSEVQVQIELGYYEGFDGSQPNNGSFQNDGAYIFRPITYKKLDQSDFRVTNKGKLVQTVSCRFEDLKENIQVNVTLRLTDSWYVELIGMVGSLKGYSSKSRTMAIRYYTNVNQRKHYFTDTNCRTIGKHRMCDGNWYDVNNTSESISGCYRPVCGVSYISDNLTDFSVIVDRTQGSTAFFDEKRQSGVVEFSVAKRSIRDDGWGMDEELMEAYADGTGIWTQFRHMIIVSSTSKGDEYRRRCILQANNRASIFIRKDNTDKPNLALRTSSRFPLTSSNRLTNKQLQNNRGPSDLLPITANLDNTSLSVLSTILLNRKDTYRKLLIRLERVIYHETTNPNSRLHDKIDLKKLFGRCINVTNVKEVYLDGQSDISPDIGFDSLRHMPLLVSFDPLQIRTFIMDTQYIC